MRPNHSLTKADRSDLLCLLIGPSVAVFAVLLGGIMLHLREREMIWPPAAQFFAACYASGIALSLFLERHQIEANRHTLVQTLIGLVAVAISGIFLLQFAKSGVLTDLRMGLYNAIAGGIIMIPRRTDKMRACALCLMAVAAIHGPVVYGHPPFVSLSILWGLLGLGCVVEANVAHSFIRRTLSLGTLMCLLVTAFGAYQIQVGYHDHSFPLLVIGIVTVAFFGLGTAMVITRGSWSERHTKHR
jgi:hypothetical protein